MAPRRKRNGAAAAATPEDDDDDKKEDEEEEEEQLLRKKKKNIHKAVATEALPFSIDQPIHKIKFKTKQAETASKLPYVNTLGEDTESSSEGEDISHTDLTDQQKFELVRLSFLDRDFPGSYSGIKNMQRQLFLIKHIHVPISIVAKALRSIPAYLMHIVPVRRFETGHYEATTIGENVQGLSKLAAIYYHNNQPTVCSEPSSTPNASNMRSTIAIRLT
jgi:hypothetical protein